MELALELGADVPFFLDPRPSRVRGIGERVEPVAGIPSLALLLVNPGLPVATAEVYRAFDALSAPPHREAPALPDLTRPGVQAGALADLVRNDLEAPAIGICPALVGAREALGTAGALAVWLSGSGGTLYGVFPDLRTAQGAQGKLRLPAPAWTRVARTLESG